MEENCSIRTVYFLGIGGIGMSALARYFVHEGWRVAGYDRTRSPLTMELEKEGVDIVYDAEEGKTGDNYRALDKETTWVVRTPAVPENEEIYTWLREQGFKIMKRSEVLGQITRSKKALCVAGTHGKTTTSTLLAHILYQSHVGANAFLGGISNNYKSNLLLDGRSDIVVVEADEFDRSFHRLRPMMSVVTSIEPDHLDIYGTAEGYQQGFDEYGDLVEQVIVLKKGFALRGKDSGTTENGCRIYTYSMNEDADFCAKQIAVEDGEIYFDFHTPQKVMKRMRLGVPVWINVENAVGALALAYLNGVTEEEMRIGLASFAGVYRRFNIKVKTEKVVYVDDYAHHPTELKQAIESVRKVYPNRKLAVVFQPHLYSRTRDFMGDFAEVLSTADELVLLPIYPARELPIEGVTSEALANECMCRRTEMKVRVVQKDRLADCVEQMVMENESMVVMTLGAGDIDRLVNELQDRLLCK